MNREWGLWIRQNVVIFICYILLRGGAINSLIRCHFYDPLYLRKSGSPVSVFLYIIEVSCVIKSYFNHSISWWIFEQQQKEWHVQRKVNFSNLASLCLHCAIFIKRDYSAALAALTRKRISLPMVYHILDITDSNKTFGKYEKKLTISIGNAFI